MDWTDVRAVNTPNKRARLATEPLERYAYASTAERVKAFVDKGGEQGDVFNYRPYLLQKITLLM